MTLESRINRNRYIGNGATTDFPFTFKVWKTDQILVYTGDGTTEEEVSSDCAVTITASGGTVTFPEAPAYGTIIVIRRNMPYIQEDDYRNGTRFDGEEVEDRFDQDCAERQDLRFDVDRAVKVPETSDKTAAEFAEEFFEALADAQQAASDAAQAAQDAIDAIDDAQAGIIAVGDAQEERIETEGDTQVQRVENAGAAILAEQGNSCMELTWVLDADIPANSDIDIDPLWYIVSRHHLQVSVNGVRQYRTKQFNEKGTQDTQSHLYTTLVPLNTGDVVNVWVCSLVGAGTATADADGLMSKEDKAKLNGIAASTSFGRTTTVLQSAVTAGTAITVPTHLQGQGLLLVWHNGVLCEEGASAQYIDASNTTITFNYNLPAGDTITAAAVAVSSS